MAPDAIRWRSGDPKRREDLEALARDLVDDRAGVEILRHKPGRRRIAVGRLASGERCLLKHYFRKPSRSLAERIRDALGYSTAAREYRALSRLHARGLAVPEVLAHLGTERGDEILVLRYLEGEPLEQALSHCDDRKALLHALGRCVAAFHATAGAHRDLHRNNVWVTSEGPVLLDLQETLPLRVRHEELLTRDRGELDASLAHLISLSEQLVLRTALLGIELPLTPDTKRALRRIGDASARRRRTHVESRTDRARSAGRLDTTLRHPLGQGMRLRAAELEGIETALAKDGDEVPHLEVRHFVAANDAEAERWRREGSPAQLGWLASRGLSARGIDRPCAVAFVDGDGGTTDARLVVERGDPAMPDASAALRLTELVRFALRVRREGVHHVDWSQEVGLAGAHGLRIEALECVRFPKQRIAAHDDALERWLRERIGAVETASPAERDATWRRYQRCRDFQITL